MRYLKFLFVLLAYGSLICTQGTDSALEEFLPSEIEKTLRADTTRWWGKVKDPKTRILANQTVTWLGMLMTDIVTGGIATIDDLNRVITTECNVVDPVQAGLIENLIEIFEEYWGCVLIERGLLEIITRDGACDKDAYWRATISALIDVCRALLPYYDDDTDVTVSRGGSTRRERGKRKREASSDSCQLTGRPDVKRRRRA